MIDLPSTTAVHRRIQKEAFYSHLTLTPSLKESFVRDVDRIFAENSLTQESLHLATDSPVKEILLLTIFLRRQDFDAKIVEAIARQNPHKLVFLLQVEDSGQLAVYYGKLYRTPWMPLPQLPLAAKGGTLAEIWQGMVAQIALPKDDDATTGSLDERLARQERMHKLEKLIAKTEAAMWKEQQAKKRFELHEKLREYKKELENEENGV